MFVTAALTIIGFSVHDTIVVFDRIRENLIRNGSEEKSMRKRQKWHNGTVETLRTAFRDFVSKKSRK